MAFGANRAGRHVPDVADAGDAHDGLRRHGLALRVGVPFREAAHGGGAESGGGGLIFQIERRPAAQGGGDGVAIIGAAEEAEHAVAMVREVGVQSDPAPVAALIGAGDFVPEIVRQRAVDADKLFRHELHGGVAHVDGNALAAAAALTPDGGGGQGGRGDAGLRGGTEGEGGRQHRIDAGQMEVAERIGRQLGFGPESGEMGQGFHATTPFQTGTIRVEQRDG